ncbi:hypothetical protein FQN54_001473 [Arachnomyces sp. PD_36]|nr:hypothetical protein FQN54_001473 [Arachnomyces sp. PD_36]
MSSEGDNPNGSSQSPSKAWEPDMSDSAQIPRQNAADHNDEPLHGAVDDENTLSPASKKLLEKCAVSMPPPSTKSQIGGSVSVIARPPGADIDFAGFNFAKPTPPATNFSCRSRWPSASETQKMTPRGKDKSMANQGLHGSDSGRASVACSETGTEGGYKKTTQSLPQCPENTPSRHSSATPNLDSSRKRSIPAPNDHAQGKPPTTSIPEKPDMMEFHANPSEKHHDVIDEQPEFDHPPLGKASEKEPNTSQVCRATPQKRDDHTGPLGVRSSAAQPSKVMKRQHKDKGRPGKPPQLPHDTGFSTEGLSSQPSEEDLFYLLIHRLRQREDSEAASAALREQMEAQIRDITQENEELQIQLGQANDKCQNQESEIGAHRGLIDRWKAKFGKLRAFITGIGNDYECLRKEGQTIKSTQSTLAGESRAINESLRHLFENTDRIEQQWSKRQDQWTQIRHDIGCLEQSLTVAQRKVDDGRQLLLQEKQRVSVLENFIRDHSLKQQKQASSILQQQAETVHKLDSLFDHIQESRDDSLRAFKSEVQPEITECLKIVKVLSDRDSMGPRDLETVHDAIHTLSTRLASHEAQSTENAEKALNLQNVYNSDLKSHFERFEEVLNSNASVTEHLIQARELNGRLEEKFRTVEEKLAYAKTENNRYVSIEKSLQQRISDLEAELQTAQQQLSSHSIDTARYEEEQDRVSQLQAQLEETLAGLAEERETVKSKENKVFDLQCSLVKAKASLEDTMHRMAGVEKENLELQEQIRRVEYRVREELSRATLMSRDQNRACYEQQVHRLKQEKVVAESSAARLQEQLSTAKASLSRAERSKSAFDEQEARITALSSQVQELDEIRRSSSKMEAEIENLKELQASSLNDKMIHEQNFEETKAENERLRAEISELQKVQTAVEESNALQEKVSALGSQISRKDAEFAELEGMLACISSRSEMVPALEKSIEEKAQEIAGLKQQTDEANKIRTEATDNYQKMTDDVAMLRKELASMEQNKADLLALQTKLADKERETDTFQERFQEIEHWSKRAEEFLRKVKILDSKESILKNWDLFEARLTEVFGGQPYQANSSLSRQTAPSNGTPKNPQRKAVESSKTSTPSKIADEKECQDFVRECHTQEMVYLRHRRNSVTISPKKLPSKDGGKSLTPDDPQCSSSFIKPFSQIQSDVLAQEPSSSPDVSLSDLSSMFPSTPCKESGLPSSQAVRRALPEAPQRLRASQDSIAEVGQKKVVGNVSRPRKASNAVKQGPAKKCHVSPTSELKRKASDSAISGNLEDPISRASTHTVNFHGLGDGNGAEERSRSTNPLANNAPSTPNQKPSQRLPPKGILKDPSSMAINRSMELHGTAGNPLDGKSRKVKTLRRTSKQLSGTKSEYFGQTSSPKPSVTGEGGIFGTSQGSSQSLTYVSRDKRRRSSRGNRYNDRFSQGVTWAE